MNSFSPPRWLSVPLIFATLALALGCAAKKIPDADPVKARAEPKKDSVAAPPPTWSNWRGPEQNGVSREKDLPEKFSTNPKAADNNLVWTAPYGGRSTPIIQNGRVYLINSCGKGVNEQERVMCFDEKDGKLLWEHKFNVFLTDIVSSRLGWTVMVGDPETGNVYAHGTQGLLFCFNKDGKVLWEHSMTEEYGRISGYGGRVTSPVVDGDLVILGMLNANWGYQGMGRTRFVAFDKKTGKVIWWASGGFPPKDTFYSTPTVANIAGQRLIISGGGDGCVHAFKVRTGEKVWSYQFGPSAVNCAPVVDGDKIYIGQGEDNEGQAQQGRIICVDGSKVKNGKPDLVWQKEGIRVKFASPILHEGLLYVCDDIGNLYSIDAKDGKQLWSFQYGRNTAGSPVLADGKIYIPEVDAQFHILKPGAAGCQVLHSQRFRSKDGVDVEISGSPAVANGRVFFMTSTTLYCIGKKDHEAKADPIPTPPAESPVGDGGGPAYLQVVPADVVLHPGESVELTAHVFNKNGQDVGSVKVESWELAGMRPPEGAPPPPKGVVPPAPPLLQGGLSDKTDSSAKLTIDDKRPLQAGRVLAKFGPLTGEVRVRVVPKLPFAADFSKVPEGRTPAGWVNCQGKFGVENKILKKLAVNANPLVARAQAYIGPPTMKDYTIEADVMANQVGKNMADVGVTASRYTFLLDGNKQSLRLVSWDAVPRVDKTIAYPWQPGTWYHLKLTVEYQGNDGVAKGKIWEKGKPEPMDWTVEFTDPIPNREGSPALYAYATGIPGDGKPGSEAFFDGVKITPNKKAEEK
jgi:outer membrane protein assembly factor BamB